jgi:hypothetical protein
MQEWQRQNRRKWKWMNSSSAADELSLTHPNPPRSSSESCAFVTDGEEGVTECERGEVRRLRSCGWGLDPCLSSVREGDKDKEALREDMTASVLGSRGAVGTAGRGVGWEWELRYPSYWMALGTLHHFFH